MKHSKCLAYSVVFAFLLVVASTQDAYAYVDPGTGSYVIQLIIAALVGVGFAIRIYWGRIKGFLSRSPSGEQEPGDSGE